MPLATALLEQAEWLVAHRRAREAAPLLDEARETFERLRVPPKLARVEQLGVRSAASATEAAV